LEAAVTAQQAPGFCEQKSSNCEVPEPDVLLGVLVVPVDCVSVVVPVDCVSVVVSLDCVSVVPLEEEVVPEEVVPEDVEVVPDDVLGVEVADVPPAVDPVCVPVPVDVPSVVPDDDVDPVSVFPLVLPPAPGAALSSGTVRAGGAPGTSSGETCEPPHPAAVSAATARKAATAGRRGRRGRSERIGSAGQGGHATAAVRAVVQVLLRELVTPVAEPEVLHGPRQGRARRRHRQDLRDDLHRLPGLPVAVRAAGLGGQEDLATGRWRPQPVQLTVGHAAAD
jgi:hypothetical protein